MTIKDWLSIESDVLADTIFALVEDELRDQEAVQAVDEALEAQGLDFTVENLADSGLFQCQTVTYQDYYSPTEYCERPAYPSKYGAICSGCEGDW